MGWRFLPGDSFNFTYEEKTMSDKNLVILIGNLGKDPEPVTGKDGSKLPFVKVQLATNKQWKKDGTPFKRTDWHTVHLNKQLAATAEKYLQKGDRIGVTGEMRTQQWQDKDGKKRISVHVQAKEIDFILVKRLLQKAGENPNVTVAADDRNLNE
jgi:single-strand DNA-binding protein